MEATRERLLQAAYVILAEDSAGVPALTFQRVAAEAQVSIPTVYRHFGDQDALLAAFVDWMRPRIGLDPAQLFSLAPEAMAALPGQTFPRFEQHGAVLRALVDSRESNRVRAAAVTDRAERAAAALIEHAPGWTKDDLKAAAGAIAVMQAPPTWRWLRDTWGLDPEAARAAATWAIGALVAALRQRPSLGNATESAERTRSTARSHRDSEDLLAERGVRVGSEAVRRWCRTCGPAIAAGLRRHRRRAGGRWHLDGVPLKTKGKKRCLSRAVDQEGTVLDILVQQRRNQEAAETFLRRVVDGTGYAPRVLVTDKLASYPPALRRGLPGAEHRRHKGLNDRAENSHRPASKRERVRRRLKSSEHAQRFPDPFCAVRTHSRPRRRLLPAGPYRHPRTGRFERWRAAARVDGAARTPRPRGTRTPVRRHALPNLSMPLPLPDRLAESCAAA